MMAARVPNLQPLRQKGDSHKRKKIAPVADGQRQPRIDDEAHLRCIRSLPCVICGYHPVDAAHLRYADAEKGKPITGGAQKPSDMWATPLCRSHHEAQHAHGNEREWWSLQGIDPIALCRALYALTGNGIKMRFVIDHAKKLFPARAV